MTNKITIIETPYAGDIERNVEYARKCMRYSLLRGESPYASHLLYTQEDVLDDFKPDERKMGIEAGFSFKHVPGAVTVFYTDLGWSSGMLQAVRYCADRHLPYKFRTLGEDE